MSTLGGIVTAPRVEPQAWYGPSWYFFSQLISFFLFLFLRSRFLRGKTSYLINLNSGERRQQQRRWNSPQSLEVFVHSTNKINKDKKSYKSLSLSAKTGDWACRVFTRKREFVSLIYSNFIACLFSFI